MNIKRKLILLGVCAVIIIAVFIANVIRKMNDYQKNEPSQPIVAEDIIIQAEAYRLLSYLEYNRSERESLPIEISYIQEKSPDGYNTFVNAAWEMGILESKEISDPMQALTYGECKSMIDRLIIRKAEFQSAYTDLGFDFSKAGEGMQIVDFIELYQKLIEIQSQQDRRIQEKTLLVLGEDAAGSDSSRMITDTDKLYYSNAKDYEKYYEQLIERQLNREVEASAQEASVDGTKSEQKIRQEAAAIKEDTFSGKQSDNLVSRYLDRGIRALVCDEELIYMFGTVTDKIVVYNVWIEKGEKLQVDTYVNGINKSFTALYKLSQSIESVVADITIENQKIVKILQKPDIIQGKVLQTGEDYIEIEGYGKVPLDENYRIYKLYGKLSMELTNSILVGYESTDFVVSSGKISAALIKEDIKAENIRVLLKTSDDQGYYHEAVKLTVDSDFTISNKETVENCKKGETVTIKPGDEMFAQGRLTIKPDEEGARIELLSVNRGENIPEYRGTIEIAQEEQGLLIINELPLEEYLYAVIPSEMPTYYGAEALRVQAVCARSYAYRHLKANSLSRYGAHVDDSVSYQVYNNIPENEASILAVKDTYGTVIKYGDEVITAYYFSTSCGHTTNAGSVWMSGVDYPYLQGKLLYAGEAGEGAQASEEEASMYEDLSSEENFKSYIEDKSFLTYDSAFNWYRWKVTMKAEEIRKVIDDTLKTRYQNNPDMIVTRTEDNEETKEGIFESIPVDTPG